MTELRNTFFTPFDAHHQPKVNNVLILHTLRKCSSQHFGEFTCRAGQSGGRKISATDAQRKLQGEHSLSAQGDRSTSCSWPSPPLGWDNSWRRSRRSRRNGGLHDLCARRCFCSAHGDRLGGTATPLLLPCSLLVIAEMIQLTRQGAGASPRQSCSQRHP